MANVDPDISRQKRENSRLAEVTVKVTMKPNIRPSGSFMYPTQNAILPITNNIEHTGITASDCDVRYVLSTS